MFARARVVATPYVVGYQSGVIHLAMTMGRAVVTSDVGDLPDAVRRRRDRAGRPRRRRRDALAEALEQRARRP